MRQTPAQAHYMRTMAAMAAAAAGATNAHGHTVGDAYDLQRAQLHHHRVALKAIKSTERKAEAKRAMLPEYDAYLGGVLQHKPGTQDEVVTTILVWAIDAGDYKRAMPLAEYALASGMTPPDNYSRDMASVVAEEIADAVMAGRLVGQEAVAVTQCALQLTAEADIHDQIRAKLCKATGWALLGKTNSTDVAMDAKGRTLQVCSAALPFLKRAMELDPVRAGVKKDIERLEQRLKK
ncbi:phage terminase small subunit [Comamonas sp. J-3]|uniref:phage terminase small subunit n=1 Tax=Comamonas trifloxystrobinivorans TaxID=3350256 RepID=UPI00372B7735